MTTIDTSPVITMRIKWHKDVSTYVGYIMHTLSFANDRFNKKYFQLEESRPCKDVDSCQRNDHMTSLCE